MKLIEIRWTYLFNVCEKQKSLGSLIQSLQASKVPTDSEVEAATPYCKIAHIFLDIMRSCLLYTVVQK